MDSKLLYFDYTNQGYGSRRIANQKYEERGVNGEFIRDPEEEKEGGIICSLYGAAPRN